MAQGTGTFGMPALFRDEILEGIEHSRAYRIVDVIFDRIGGVGELVLVVYLIRVTWWHHPVGITGFFWLKIFLLAVGLLLIKEVKNTVAAWAGIAPPHYDKPYDSISPGMQVILDAQRRAERIRKRGIRVDEMLDENKRLAEKKLGQLS